MYRKLLACCAVLMLLGGCASTMTGDIEVATEANPEVDLAGYKTYSWIGSAAILNDPEGRWEPPDFDADAELIFLINRELRAQGMSETRVDPDLLVFYGAGIDMASVDIKIDPATDTEEFSNVPRGALLVVLVDSETEAALWGGVATAEIKQDPDPEVVRKRLDYAIRTMFQRFPN